jgi:hypothetical protein
MSRQEDFHVDRLDFGGMKVVPGQGGEVVGGQLSRRTGLR